MDKRSINTKEKLIEAFSDILKETSFDKITIGEICDKANINRVTFYNHFEDKYDLFIDYLDNSIKKLFDETNNKNDIKENPKEFFKTLFYNIAILSYQNKSIIKSPDFNQNSLVSYIIQKKANENLANLIDYRYKKEELKYSSSTCAAFLTGGFSNLVSFYLSKDKNIDELIVEANQIIDDLLNIVIVKKSKAF